jgi:hypothetical protein
LPLAETRGLKTPPATVSGRKRIHNDYNSLSDIKNTISVLLHEEFCRSRASSSRLELSVLDSAAQAKETLLFIARL